jgi:hypothetical protein
MNIRNLVCFAFVLILSSAVLGGTYDISEDNIEYTIGEGVNYAKIIVDMDQDEHFVFGFRWDGVANAYDATLSLDDEVDIANGTCLDIKTLFYPGMGSVVKDLNYHLGTKVDYVNDYGDPVNNAGWGYYVGMNNESWTSPWDAAGDYDLSDGELVTWVWTNSAPYGHPDGWVQYRGPNEAPMSIPPVPEPATLAMLAIGGLIVRSKRKAA